MFVSFRPFNNNHFSQETVEKYPIKTGNKFNYVILPGSLFIKVRLCL